MSPSSRGRTKKNSMPQKKKKNSVLQKKKKDSMSQKKKKNSMPQKKKSIGKNTVVKRIVVKRNLFAAYDNNCDHQLSPDYVVVKRETNAEAILPSSGKSVGKDYETAIEGIVKIEPVVQEEDFSVKQSVNDYTIDDECNPSDESTFRCSVCSKRYCRKFQLKRHMKSQHSDIPPKKFQCEVCNKAYVRKHNWKEHMRVHDGLPARVLSKKHKCRLCGKAFHGQSLLTVHLRTHTGERPFSCEECLKTFPSAGSLSQHKLTHTDEKPFECSQCKQRFTMKASLLRHMHLHTEAKPFVCSYCGKKYTQNGGLKAHMFYHTGENGFKCEDCGKQFNRKSCLKMHRLCVHEKYRPFSCDKCRKTFPRIEDLNRHSVVHTGERAFACPTCGKSFSSKYALKLHLRTHTKEEPISCKQCCQTFIRKDCLIRHVRKKHPHLCASLLEENSDVDDPNICDPAFQNLQKNTEQLLKLLLDKTALLQLGWPGNPVNQVLEALIKHCGFKPVDPREHSGTDQMRENVKLLFTSVINDDAINTLLKNKTVDEVILQVLHLEER